MRLDNDFDPGNVMAPEISLMGCKTISDAVHGFSAATMVAEILTSPTLEDLEINMELPLSRFKTQDFEEPHSCDFSEIEFEVEDSGDDDDVPSPDSCSVNMKLYCRDLGAKRTSYCWDI
ncbi:hypothetical protein G2W53_017184 [Senna tora]|uniref:Uncharacterized protein n=1 Tax=Senna tora TaxID=362788 RepID=A0A834TQ04_9FABA|nr:hypothetical protein G2W53_017184 [Senna tora]